MLAIPSSFCVELVTRFLLFRSVLLLLVELLELFVDFVLAIASLVLFSILFLDLYLLAVLVFSVVVELELLFKLGFA